MHSPLSFGPYRVLDEISRGGMGIVYRARHAQTERSVAVKAVTFPEPLWIESLRREIDALKSVHHPGIVRILEHGVQDGLPWYAMDLLEGERLREFITRIWSSYRGRSTPPGPTTPVTETAPVSCEPPLVGPSPERLASVPGLPGVPPAAAGALSQVLALMRRLCATLAFLHGEGFVSCDIKPENVIVVGSTPVLIDLGISARFPAASGREAIDDQDGRHGTVLYMSPEHLRRELVDARSDLYAVGCVLYELLTGTPPFVGPPNAVRGQHFAALPTPPSELVQGVPAPLEALVLRLLAKDSNDRVGFADEVAGALAEIGADSEPLSEFPPPRPYLYRPRFVGRSRVLDELVALGRQAALGQGTVVLIAGESGAGKTRLALELTRASTEVGLRVIASEFDAASPGQEAALASSPLQAVRPLLRAIADRCQRGGPEVTERLLGTGHAVLAQYEPLLAHVPSTQSAASIPPLAPDAARRRLLRHVVQSLTAFACETPLVWIWDDLGWADDLSFALLRSLGTDAISTIPLLLVGTYRTETASDKLSELAAASGVVHMSLSPLRSEDVGRMVADMLALPSASPEFASFVASAAEGNPFFVTEHVRSAVLEHVFYRDRTHAWRMRDSSTNGRANYEALPLPRSLQELIDHRLRSLSQTAQTVAAAAAVLGRESAQELVIEVAGLSADGSRQAIRELLRRHILEQPSPMRLRFSHDKIREVAYGISAERKRFFHARAADAVERAAQGADAAESWATLGHHYAEAGIAARSRHYLKLAADRARATFANADAIALYRRAIALASEAPELESGGSVVPAMLRELNEALGAVLALVGRRDEARAAYSTALIHVADGDTVSRARLHRLGAHTFEAEGDYSCALEGYIEAQALLPPPSEASGDSERHEWILTRFDQMRVYYWTKRHTDMEALVTLLGPAVDAYGTAHHLAGYYQSQFFHRLARDRHFISDDTLALSERVLKACGGDGAPQRAWAHFQRGFALLLARRPAEAEDFLRDGYTLAYRAGDIVNQARSALYLAVAARARGEVDAVPGRCVLATRVCDEASMPQYVAAAKANEAWVALRRGDLDEALRLTDIALSGWSSYAGVFPFHWLGLVPRLEVQLGKGMLAGAAASCRGLLNPAQRQLPEAIEVLLHEALAGYASGDAAAAMRSLTSTLDALETHQLR